MLVFPKYSSIKIIVKEMKRGYKMTKLFTHIYTFECFLFKYINQFYKRKLLNTFFHGVTHLGGASFTISISLLFIIISSHSLQATAIASAVALTISHIPVALLKKLLPRKRPYLVIEHINVTQNPLKDHSFPSGHTTAIFSIVVPFIIFYPTLSILLLPIACAVGLSRIYLGLHYPSDVIVGCLLGCTAGYISHAFIHAYFI